MRRNQAEQIRYAKVGCKGGVMAEGAHLEDQRRIDTRLQEGMVIEDSTGERFRIDLVNYSRARCVPLTKHSATITLRDGRQFEVNRLGATINISPNSDVKILRWDKIKKATPQFMSSGLQLPTDMPDIQAEKKGNMSKKKAKKKGKTKVEKTVAEPTRRDTLRKAFESAKSWTDLRSIARENGVSDAEFDEATNKFFAHEVKGKGAYNFIAVRSQYPKILG